MTPLGQSGEWACAKCGEVQPDWWQFGVGCPTRKVYCLHHIPLRYRLRVRWQEWRREGPLARVRDLTSRGRSGGSGK